MLKLLASLIVLLTLTTATYAALPYGDYTLTFQDQFNGACPNKALWNTTYPKGRRDQPSNKELEWYADDAFMCGNGVLNIIADKRTVNPKYAYTSGILASWGKFSQKYGYFEIKAKLPKGQGLWPAFWLLPADGAWPPELDVFENMGQYPTVIQMTSHYFEDWKHKDHHGRYIGPDFTAGYHTFGMDWQPDKIVWYVDDVERFRVTQNIPQVPMYVLVNLAVGGSWTGPPNASTKFPAVMSVDWIKVYQK